MRAHSSTWTEHWVSPISPSIAATQSKRSAVKRQPTLGQGKTLTRLATLGTLSRSAGEGCKPTTKEPLSRTAGEGGDPRIEVGGRRVRVLQWPAGNPT